MARVLVTGISGAGKSTLLAAVAERGFRTVDTDLDGWTLPDGRWDEPRMSALLEGAATVAVSGTVDNQGTFYPSFDQVVLLSAPVAILLDRVSARTTNPYGRSTADQEEIRRYLREVEPLLRRGATVELDGTRPVAELADLLADLLRSDG